MPNPKIVTKTTATNLAAMARIAATTFPGSADTDQHRRRMIADLCRILADHTADSRRSSLPNPITKNLSPRMKQTLDRLLSGDGEKQIAHNLQISRHTVHVYVKKLYQRFGVCSRGKLLARFVHK